MRLLLLSDIHSNAVALEAVLRDARRRRWDSVLFLGDLVGYYTDPNGVAELLADLGPAASLLGNHDQLLLDMVAGAGVQGSEDDVAVSVLERHKDEISDQALDLVAQFVPIAHGESWQAVHGGLRHPWEYIDSITSAQANFALMDRQLCFVGHTHVPKLFATVRNGREALWRTFTFNERRNSYRIPPKARVIFNPGSVGQPRDGVPLASYAIYDEELGTIELHRVEFDLLAVQRAVRELDYPPSLGQRLAEGR